MRGKPLQACDGGHSGDAAIKAVLLNRYHFFRERREKNNTKYFFLLLTDFGKSLVNDCGALQLPNGW